MSRGIVSATRISGDSSYGWRDFLFCSMFAPRVCAGLATLILPPTKASFLHDALSMELSIHALGSDLRKETIDIFPGAPTEGQLMCCLTFQFAGGGTIDLSPDRSSATLHTAATEMDRLLDGYMRWEDALRAKLKDYWCDSVDPRT